MSAFTPLVRNLGNREEDRIRKEVIIRRPRSAAQSGVPTRVSLPATALADALLSGLIRTTANNTLTTDTAVNIIAEIPNARIGDYFDCVVQSATASATVAGGVGVTVVGTATVGANVGGVFRFVMTAATTMDCMRVDGS